MAGVKKYSVEWFWVQYWEKHRTMTDIAEETGWSVGTIHNWFKEWGFPSKSRGGTTVKMPQSKLSDDDIREIKARASDGETRTHLAKSFGISRARLYKILNGEHRRLV